MSNALHNDDLGLPKTVRTSFRACSRYMVKSTGLSPSPWGVPTLLVKGAFISALFILVLMCVLLNKNCMSLSSSSSTMFFRICRRISLSMVSNAADMSIPVIFIFMFSMSRSSWFVNVLFNMFAIVWSRRGVEYFSSSGYIWSSPGALLFLSRLRFFLISACVIGWLIVIVVKISF